MLLTQIKSDFMTDVFSTKKRSEIMSRITGKNTKPEIAVRKALSSLGIKYRLHNSKLKGKPDLSNRERKFAIFVNGCFWHQHKGCKRNSTPKSNIEYWLPKLERNIVKQKEDVYKLHKEGWKTLIIWECEIRNVNEILLKFYKLL